MADTANTWAQIAYADGVKENQTWDVEYKAKDAKAEPYGFGNSPYRSMAEYMTGRENIGADRKKAVNKMNYQMRLQWMSETNQGIADITSNIRAADSWAFYAMVNAGYGQIANHQVFADAMDNLKLKDDRYGTKTGLGYALSIFLGKSGVGGGNADEVKALASALEGTTVDKVYQSLAGGMENLKGVDLGGLKDKFLDSVFKDFTNAKDFITDRLSTWFDDKVTAAEAFALSVQEGFSLKALGSAAIDKLIELTGSVFTKAISLFRRVYDIKAEDVMKGTPSALYRTYVMNTPPTASMIIDPMHRNYNNHVMATTHVLNIIPGNLWYGGFTAREARTSSYQLEKELEDFEKGETGEFVFDTDSAIYKMVRYSADKNKRMGWFEPTPMKFQRVYSALMAKVLARISNKPAMSMSIDDVKDPLGGLNMNGWGHIAIALGPNCTITENASNSFEGGQLESTIDGLKDQVNNFRKTISSYFGTAFSGKAIGRLEKMAGAKNPISAVIGNSTMHWPKFWQSSDMSRSYTLSFRLESPYGNYQSLVEYVYKPFLALLACSLPIQTSFYGATTPFVIRCDCPGMFTISEGYVSTIDFRRAPDQNTYTANGLASAIEVNMSITDIDPYLSVPTGPAGFAADINMAAWLDSLCGVGYQEIYSGGSMAHKLKAATQFAKLMPSAAKGATESIYSRKAWSLFSAGPVR